MEAYAKKLSPEPHHGEVVLDSESLALESALNSSRNLYVIHLTHFTIILIMVNSKLSKCHKRDI